MPLVCLFGRCSCHVVGCLWSVVESVGSSAVFFAFSSSKLRYLLSRAVRNYVDIEFQRALRSYLQENETKRFCGFNISKNYEEVEVKGRKVSLLNLGLY